MAQQTLQTFNKALAITKSDTVAIPLVDNRLSDAIWVGGAGDVVAVFGDATTALFTCAAGTLLPIKCVRVNSSSTTATAMLALWQV